MKKTLKRMAEGVLSVILTLGLWTHASAEEKTAEPRKDFRLLSKGMGFDITYTWLGAHIDNMPLEIRDVPVHPDDSWAEDNRGPIKETKFNASHAISVPIMYEREYGTGSKDPLRIRYGYGLEWTIDVGATFEERNYTTRVGSDRRGDGAALTYVSMRQGGMIPSFDNGWSDIFLNWTPRVKFEVAPFGGTLKNLWFGTSASYFSIAAQNGYDRYDKIDVRKNYTVLHVVPVRAYATLFSSDDDMRIGFTLGAQFQPAFETDMGRKAEASIEPVTIFTAICLRF